MDKYEKRQLIYKAILGMFFVGCVTAIITFHMTCERFSANKNLLTVSLGNNSSNDGIDNISKTLKNFRSLINQHYIGEIDEQKVLDETIKGYVKGLGDKYSEYMTKADWEDYQADALGKYVGIGIYMSLDAKDNVVILEPIEGSPAEEAGIKAGDIIVEVDGESMIGASTSKAANKIKGEAGTNVNLKVIREDNYLDFEIERREIKVFHVKREMLDNNIGYIKLSTFDEGCADEFKNAFEELQSQDAKKLIIDLRDNTGGLVDEALDIVDMFVEKDKSVLITVDAKDKKDVTLAKKDPIVNDMDVIVLVNKYSASASEIFVGALKDNGKATIVGDTTYGKGVIQNVYSLTDGSVLKLTTSEYFTPNETKIHEVGIEPDVVVEEDNTTKEDIVLNKALEILNSI